jgi:thiamine-phosphate pyrophosphorylase
VNFKTLFTPMPLDPTHFPVMCITQDGLPLTPAAQVARLCAAGARWIQLRMKNAAPDSWLATAREVVAICHAHGALCIVNDNVDIALAAGADGVHLGKFDLDCREARRRLGPLCLIGGTVNNVDEADLALAAGCLDYVGVGPLRFTTTKQKLSPVLGLDGVIACIVRLDGLPAWAIGGVEATDLPSLRAVGAAGVAVSGALFRQDKIEENYRAFAVAWNSHATSRAQLN